MRKRQIALNVTDEERNFLIEVSRSRTESAGRVQRARILLGRAAGKRISELAAELSTNRKLIERTIDRAAAFGCIAGLEDLARKGRSRRIDDEARAWLTSIACRQPKDIGFAAETWTNDALAKYVRENCVSAGHPSLLSIGRGTVNKMLNKAGIKPHKLKYYLERRDPDFEAKMAVVLHLYKEVMLENENPSMNRKRTTMSYDEKPGIQAIGDTAPVLKPNPGKHKCLGRDYEYKRFGTLSILAGIDLHNGHIYHKVCERHGSEEFIGFLRLLSDSYPPDWRIRVLMDNHSVHRSKETMAFLATVPERFEFVFTPKHASWLNVIEMVFSKMARTFLRFIRVSGKEELKERITLGIEEMNANPQVFRWKYKMDEICLDTSPVPAG